jgi:hypothetical protein
MSVHQQDASSVAPVVREALLQYYRPKLSQSGGEMPDGTKLSLSEGRARDNENWRIRFIIQAGSQRVEGAVFQGVDGRHYIDDARNRTGTSVYQSIDGYFR